MSHRRRFCWIVGLAAATLFSIDPLVGADEFSQGQALKVLLKAVDFYSGHVGQNGAYLYRYSDDLRKQEGEHEAHWTTGWTQPPGTPAVGAAYLDVYLLTRDAVVLDAAREVADALLFGQLRSGGWYHKFEAEPERRRQYAYRIEPSNPKGINLSTLDDNKTQSVITFLMHFDEVTEFQHARIGEAVRFALSRLIAAQTANGAWPQQFSRPSVSAGAMKPASYPDQWSREHEQEPYHLYYTLNDNAISDTIDVMLEAARIYDRTSYREAAERAGDFLRSAQMPDPQPGWAQQYNAKMEPAWARKFEPPAITGGESQGVMRTLLKLYNATGEKRFLEPLPKALAYYRRSLLPDGRLARFYELKTNKPLYFTKEYQLTYSDSSLPSHYSFKITSRLDEIEAEYLRLQRGDAGGRVTDWRPQRVPVNDNLRDAAKRVAEAADPRGAWVEDGELRTYSDNEVTRVITTRTYIRNLVTLSRYASANQASNETAH